METSKVQYKKRRSASDYKGETNFSPSATIPDHTLPIREMVMRYVNGQPLPPTMQREMYYDGEDADPRDPRTLDLTEIADLQALYSSQAREYNQKQSEALERAKNALKTPPAPSVGKEITEGVV